MKNRVDSGKDTPQLMHLLNLLTDDILLAVNNPTMGTMTMCTMTMCTMYIDFHKAFNKVNNDNF